VHLGNVRAQLKQLLDARRPLYAEVATSTVVTDGCSIEEVVAAALAAVPAGSAHAG
jgi:shikimate kinase